MKKQLKKTKSKQVAGKTKPKAPITQIHGLPSSWRLIQSTISMWWEHRLKFLAISAMYAMLSLLLARSAQTVTIAEIKDAVAEETGTGLLNTTVTAGVALSSPAQDDASASAYQFFLFVVFSLATIWMIRRLIAGQKFQLRDVFYKGMYPLIPFILTLLLIAVQTIPFFVGGLIYSFVSLGGIALSFIEQVPFLILWLLLSAATGYMLAASIMSMYAVTLPDMRPIQALKAVRKTVIYRRWHVLARIILIIFMLSVLFSVTFIMFIWLLPDFAFVSIDVLWALFIPVLHLYLFKLYKALV